MKRLLQALNVVKANPIRHSLIWSFNGITGA